MKFNKEQVLALLVALLVFFAITVYFVFPVFQGKEMRQSDIIQHEGSAQEIVDYREKGEQILWTNSMFSGMPAYMISVQYSGNLFKFVQLAIYVLPHPAPYLFFLMFNFFILLIAMRADPWIAISGAVAFAFSTYFIVVLAAGHNSKVDAILWLPGILAGLYVAYRRNIWLGAALFGFSMGLELRAGHPQMFYYFIFFATAFVLTEGIGALVEKKLPAFLKASAMLAVFGALALGSAWSYVATTEAYSKYTIRGKSELTSNIGNKTSGLDRDYVTQWSNGIGETWSFLIPNIKGGESGDITRNKTAVEAVPAKDRRMLQGNSYWGDQPFTGGPVYVGAGVFLFFLFSLFFVKDRIKWPILVITLFTLMLSWGRNFPLLTDFMLDYFPLYTKFRAVTSIVIVPEFIIPLLAFLGVAGMVSDKDVFSRKATIFGLELPFTNQALFLGVSGALLFIVGLMFLAPGLFTSFFAEGEYEDLMQQLAAAGFPQVEADRFLETLETARMAILRADVIRSFLVILFTVAAVWSFARFRYNKYIFAALLFVITAVDIISINRRYLNASNFVPKKEMAVNPSVADAAILRDPDMNYRVANISLGTFQDASTSYFHKSIGGYHGAKLRRYQELIEHSLSVELQRLIGTLRSAPTEENVMATLQGLRSLNMLNARYFILNPEGAPLRNPYAMGNAWFPSEIKWVDNADQEMAELLKADPRTVAIADKKFESAIGGVTLAPDSVSRIRETSYHPEKMEYEAEVPAEKVAVFSEIWYPEGWVCSIDGNEVPIGRVNYVLRAVKIPAGKHTVTFEFKPAAFKFNEMISRITSGLLLLLCLGVVIKELMPYFRPKPAKS